MSKRSNAEKDIRSNVFKFYAENKKLCDDSYEMAEDENIHRLYEVIENDDQKNLLFAKVSVIVLTANKYENNMLHKRIYGKNGGETIKKMEIDISTPCDIYNKVFAYYFTWNNYDVLHINANVTGSYSIGGSADIVRWVTNNEYLHPFSIVSLGICFGTNEKSNNLGDVVISKKIYPYFVGAKVNDEELYIVDDNSFRIDSDLYNRINGVFTENKFNSLTSKLGINVFFDNYITGEAVVSSYKARSVFVSTTKQKTKAGDMESYGLFKECKNKSYMMDCLTIKSICDWGVSKNFSAYDKETLNEFIAIINTSNIEKLNNENERYYQQSLETLKDRIQAYSASCAFDAFDILMSNNVFKKSLLDLLKDHIGTYKGVATTCKKITERTQEIANSCGLDVEISKPFIHTVIFILCNEGIINCENGCSLNNCNCSKNVFISCPNKMKDSSIEIVKKGV